MNEICSMKETLIEIACRQLKDVDNCDAHEFGKVIDMIKDLSELEYYEAIIDAMDVESVDRFGYNNRRYINGRYAPTGRGHVSGYNRNPEMYPYIDGYLNDGEEFAHKMRYGYIGQEHRNREADARYGRAFNEFRDAKKHYVETKSTTDKDSMSQHAKEHLEDTITSIREIWADADTSLKKSMKASLTSLVNEMTV